MLVFPFSSTLPKKEKSWFHSKITQNNICCLTLNPAFLSNRHTSYVNFYPNSPQPCFGVKKTNPHPTSNTPQSSPLSQVSKLSWVCYIIVRIYASKSASLFCFFDNYSVVRYNVPITAHRGVRFRGMIHLKMIKPFCQGPRWVRRIMNKNRSQKSRDPLPLHHPVPEHWRHSPGWTRPRQSPALSR